MNSDERFFYHSFPRRGRDTIGEVTKGCEILALIRDAGLLLAPEIVEWRYSHANGSPPRVERFLQNRVCFTELSPSELARHASEFGHFALEFRIETIRKLGGMPVFYVPNPKEANDSTPEQLGSTLVIQLMDARNLANHIAGLSEVFRGPVPVEREIDFCVEFKENPNATKSFRLVTDEAKKTLEAITHGVTPARMLADGITGTLNLFYPTDGHTENSTMVNYRQREWRIIGNVSVKGVSLMKRLNPEERDQLQRIDAEFFGRVLECPLGDVPLLDACLMYPKLNGEPIIELVNRVIVPDSAVAKAKNVLSGLRRPPMVVSLTEIAESPGA
ncbi:MAG: hypothetical protein HY302_00145 [Opitutae bacterium]|nr:hypothetical protein [Opitutae bacterium]